MSCGEFVLSHDSAVQCDSPRGFRDTTCLLVVGLMFVGRHCSLSLCCSSSTMCLPLSALTIDASMRHLLRHNTDAVPRHFVLKR